MPDVVVYLNDDDEKKVIHCKVLDVNSFVKFEVTNGKVISIPADRVLKVKQGGTHEY